MEIAQLKQLAVVTEGLITAFRDRRISEAAHLAASEQSQHLTRSLTLLEQVKELSGVGGWELQLDPLCLTWTEETKRIHEVPLDYEPKLGTAIEFYAPEARDIISAHVAQAIDPLTWAIFDALQTSLLKNRRPVHGHTGCP